MVIVGVGSGAGMGACSGRSLHWLLGYLPALVVVLEAVVAGVVMVLLAVYRTCFCL